MAVPPLVDQVRELARERPRARAARKARGEGAAIRVRFAGGASALLDAESPRDRVWAEVLGSLRESGQPAYVEIDPETRRISSLLLPQRFTVTALREAERGGDVEVELEISHARHWLRREHPRFGELHALLERARRERTAVLVTESLDSTAIVDVRAEASPPSRRGT